MYLVYDLRVTNLWPYAELDDYIHLRLKAGWASHAHTGLDPIRTCQCQAEDRLRPCIRMLSLKAAAEDGKAKG
jgi:hypothetical protein